VICSYVSDEFVSLLLSASVMCMHKLGLSVFHQENHVWGGSSGRSAIPISVNCCITFVQSCFIHCADLFSLFCQKQCLSHIMSLPI